MATATRKRPVPASTPEPAPVVDPVPAPVIQPENPLRSEWSTAARIIYNARSADVSLIARAVLDPDSLRSALSIAETLKSAARDESLRGLSGPVRVRSKGEKAADARTDSANPERLLGLLRGERVTGAPAR